MIIWNAWACIKGLEGFIIIICSAWSCSELVRLDLPRVHRPIYNYGYFGLFTEIAIRKFLPGLAVVWSETFFKFCPLYVFVHFLPLFIRRIVP